MGILDDFHRYENAFREQRMSVFNLETEAVLWLKAKSLCRTSILQSLARKEEIVLTSKSLKEKHRELFQRIVGSEEVRSKIDRFLNDYSNELYSSSGIDETRLQDDLYRIQSYEWGGGRSNSLDRHLVSHYVKSVSSLDSLVCKRNEIEQNAWNYVVASWYNNWTSYLIEGLFKKNPSCLSAPGEIKGVDFFLGNLPVDLKVTFFPAGFMAEKLKRALGKSEQAWLREKAKDSGITSGISDEDGFSSYALADLLEDNGQKAATEYLKECKKGIVLAAQESPFELMKWLYENQGEMRFGAENRLFLILADTENGRDSWKLKRAVGKIAPLVEKYLDGFKPAQLKAIDFQFNGRQYSSLADALFVIK